MVFYKVGATKELFSHVIGAVDTPEKFEARRLALAERVWAEMKGNDSANCRHCHSVAEWDLALHKPRARAQHEDMTRTGETCIDCHKGIAHKAVHEKTEEDDAFTLEEEAEPFELQ
jgi:cytochrome c-type protein NapC